MFSAGVLGDTALPRCCASEVRSPDAPRSCETQTRAKPRRGYGEKVSFEGSGAGVSLCLYENELADAAAFVSRGDSWVGRNGGGLNYSSASASRGGVCFFVWDSFLVGSEKVENLCDLAVCSGCFQSVRGSESVCAFGRFPSCTGRGERGDSAGRRMGS